MTTILNKTEKDLKVGDHTFPSRAIAPFARLNVRVRRSSGAIIRSPGSGFIVGASPFVITAAHVVTGKGKGVPYEVQIDVRPPGSAAQRVWGVGVAWPEDWEDRDMAVVALRTASVNVEGELSRAAVPSGLFTGAAVGFPADKARKRVCVRAEKGRPWVEYLSGQGSPGMSGGALLLPPEDEEVVGLHVGDVDGEQVAMPLVQTLLSKLRAALSGSKP